MKRREFVALLAGCDGLAARGAGAAIRRPVIGYLGSGLAG